MKKTLALAPAVALAITGLAASPVFAATDAPTAPSADTQPAQKSTSTQSLKAATAAPQAEEKGITIDPKSISLDEFAKKPGVVISGAQLEAETEYTMTVTPSGDQNVEPITIPVTTDASGAFGHDVYAMSSNEAYIGGYSVSLVNSGNSEETYSGSFEVTKNDDAPETPAVDPKVSISDKKVSESDFEKDGLKVTGEGFTPGGKVTVIGAATQSPFYQDEITADKDGKISTSVKAPEAGLKPGDYSVYAVDATSEEKSDNAKFTITKDEATEDPTTPAAEAKLTVSPETVSAADFVKEKKGVTLAVENCEPGSDVRYLVNPSGKSNVTAFDKTVKADDEGKASVKVYGTSASDPSAYVGDYDVTVTCGDDELTGKFSVDEDANAGGSDGNDNGNSDGNDNGNGGGDLPRTGTELTGLAGGAGLLLVGGAAVALTMRRKKTTQDPAEI